MSRGFAVCVFALHVYGKYFYTLADGGVTEENLRESIFQRVQILVWRF